MDKNKSFKCEYCDYDKELMQEYLKTCFDEACSQKIDISPNENLLAAVYENEVIRAEILLPFATKSNYEYYKYTPETITLIKNGLIPQHTFSNG